MSEARLKRRAVRGDEEASSEGGLEAPDPSEATEDVRDRTTQGPDNTVLEETGEKHQEVEVRKQRRGKMTPEEA